MARIADTGGVAQLVLSSEGEVLNKTTLTDQYTQLSLKTRLDEVVKLESSNGYNMRITSVGCQ